MRAHDTDLGSVAGILTQTQWLARVAQMAAWLSAVLTGRAAADTLVTQISPITVTWLPSGDTESLLDLLARLRRLGVTTVDLRLHAPGDMPPLLPGAAGDVHSGAGCDLVGHRDGVGMVVIVPAEEHEGLWPWLASPVTATTVDVSGSGARRATLERLTEATASLTALGTTTPHADLSVLLGGIDAEVRACTLPAHADHASFALGLRVWAMTALARTTTMPVPTAAALAARDAILADLARASRRTLEASCRLAPRGH